MSVAAVRRVVSRLEPGGPRTDAELVRAIAPDGVDRESAFAELVNRHGPMVLGVCRGVLADSHAAEDAFQAVFLVLARKANSIHPPGAVGGWLYGVAVRTARKSKTATVRQRRREMAAIVSAGSAPTSTGSAAPGELERAELRAIIDAELAVLPDTHRAAIVLCDLQGKTRSEAALELDRAEGTVAAWLARGRKTLANRLARRGVSLPATGLVTVVTPSIVSAELTSVTIGSFVGRGVSDSVLALAEGVMRSLSSTSTKLVTTVLTVGALLTAVATAPAWYAHPEPIAPPSTGAATVSGAEPRAKAASSLWKEAKVLELTGWLGGSAVYSADGKVLFIGGTDGHVHAYDVVSWKKLWEYRGAGHFAALAVVPDGKELAVTTKDGVMFLDALTGKANDTLEVRESAPYAVAFFPDTPILSDGQLVATSRKVIFGSAREATVKSWLKWPNVSTITLQARAADKQPSDSHAVPLAVDPDGKRVVVTGSLDKATGKNVLWAWAAGSGAGNELLEGHKATVVSAAWSKDGKWIVTGDADGTVIVWDAVKFKEKSRLALGGRIAAVTVSADGKHTAAAVVQPQERRERAYSEEVFVWPTARPPEKPELISSHPVGGPFAGIASLAFHPDGTELTSAFANFDHLSKLGELTGKVRVFTLSVPEKPAPKPAADHNWSQSSVLTDHAALVNGVAVAPDGKSFAAATDANVTCWDTVTRRVLWTYKPFNGNAPVLALAYSPDSKHLCVAGPIDVMRLDIATGKSAAWYDQNEIVVRFGKMHALAYHPERERLAASDGYATKVQNLAQESEGVFNGERPEESKPLPVLPASVAWSKGGKQLALIRHKQDKSCVVLWEPGRAESEVELTGHAERITCVVWSQDGDVIASGDDKGTVILWDARTHKELWRKRYGDGAGRIHALAISPEDNTVAIASHLGARKGPERVVLLAAKDGAEIRHLLGPEETAVSSLVWSSDGKFLVTGCGMPAARAGGQAAPRVGEVVVWERKP
ncbi:sigma-70 family rna polymerase sigma factor : Uncultured bacterium genome assembly Metasoil_fosmids_resub OS=uncultured bacterium PE=4 SV=1: Sigma70_r2: Sigma70_r4_2: WD40: WD40 [Gemmata massiliana]|uniref:ECF RNA polymerase sigma factor SigE n=1 Tax=Gemmata massiliana TaxID=1210884 RepID=A0A6P2DAT1_9BACT|nr:sigma-70 family RNA polymerase sigma factor [Gemmata massiliana]VTR97686.1 sigma-70 family rna polymerase sigma factor : Uncultured bacterium genome assembly Metasoil_fosmids_resub OS=uncultured bacterium PE=4 SV=1: Sigma70_r2: Sigma70_r4_2: WD40: WD40 [Gemmata massiliana]